MVSGDHVLLQSEVLTTLKLNFKLINVAVASRITNLYASSFFFSVVLARESSCRVPGIVAKSMHIFLLANAPRNSAPGSFSLHHLDFVASCGHTL